MTLPEFAVVILLFVVVIWACLDVITILGEIRDELKKLGGDE